MFTHPRWNPSTINNDISLIKLASPVRLSDSVSPVCLAETSDVFNPGMTCVTSGWGLTRYNGEAKSNCGSQCFYCERQEGSVSEDSVLTFPHSS